MAVTMPGIVPEVIQEPGGRVKGLTIVKPIVYGNVARYFGKKREEDGHTHQWTVYLKSYKNEDMSTYVKKVHFKLHESYPNQNRVVTKPPYEVTETGWGEFEIVIKIYFMDTTERPVTLYHILKLFQSETNIMLGKKQLVTEMYDELRLKQCHRVARAVLGVTELQSIQSSESTVSFFEFSKEPAKRKAWEINLHRKDWCASDTSVLCSAHLTAGSYNDDQRVLGKFGIPSKKPSLWPDAVPTVSANSLMSRLTLTHHDSDQAMSLSLRRSCPPALHSLRAAGAEFVTSFDIMTDYTGACEVQPPEWSPTELHQSHIAHTTSCSSRLRTSKS
ncbi:hypothetical protein HPB51_021317 [Rhipicephalus microplus]|uniref:YEATS domain-containing protein 4 n=1 Tax=Rhipicephalus microplus TaxID=6941 RepID=A0A9J6F7I4_RHIMP|nr:hypothetical protein HPB51_021317 [Rhipicephalus microplus]